MAAAEAGQLAALAYLIERGAAPDLRDAKGQTALHRAKVSATTRTSH